MLIERDVTPRQDGATVGRGVRTGDTFAPLYLQDQGARLLLLHVHDRGGRPLVAGAPVGEGILGPLGGLVEIDRHAFNEPQPGVGGHVVDGTLQAGTDCFAIRFPA